jgi:hypothetical protein
VVSIGAPDCIQFGIRWLNVWYMVAEWYGSGGSVVSMAPLTVFKPKAKKMFHARVIQVPFR